jgi:hypothetical protein
VYHQSLVDTYLGWLLSRSQYCIILAMIFENFREVRPAAPSAAILPILPMHRCPTYAALSFEMQEDLTPPLLCPNRRLSPM